MTKKEKDIFDSLVMGGVIGAALGALLSKDKGTGTALGSIAGAAILASFQATENAAKTEIPLVQEIDNALYEVYSNGTKKLIKQLPRSDKRIPKKFTLK